MPFQHCIINSELEQIFETIENCTIMKKTKNNETKAYDYIHNYILSLVVSLQFTRQSYLKDYSLEGLIKLKNLVKE